MFRKFQFPDLYDITSQSHHLRSNGTVPSRARKYEAFDCLLGRAVAHFHTYFLMI